MQEQAGVTVHWCNGLVECEATQNKVEESGQAPLTQALQIQQLFACSEATYNMPNMFGWHQVFIRLMDSGNSPFQKQINFVDGCHLKWGGAAIALLGRNASRCSLLSIPPGKAFPHSLIATQLAKQSVTFHHLFFFLCPN